MTHKITTMLMAIMMFTSVVIVGVGTVAADDDYNYSEHEFEFQFLDEETGEPLVDKPVDIVAESGPDETYRVEKVVYTDDDGTISKSGEDLEIHEGEEFGTVDITLIDHDYDTSIMVDLMDEGETISVDDGEDGAEIEGETEIQETFDVESGGHEDMEQVFYDGDEDDGDAVEDGTNVHATHEGEIVDSGVIGEDVDDDGAVDLELNTRADYAFFVDSYEPKTTSPSTVSPEIELETTDDGKQVTTNVTDSDGDPIQGAEMDIETSEDSHTVVTNSEGLGVFEGIEGDTVSYDIEHPNFEDMDSEEFDLDDGDELSISMTPDESDDDANGGGGGPVDDGPGEDEIVLIGAIITIVFALLAVMGAATRQ